MAITKTFTITTNDELLMRRFERFLALLHFNSRYGHSAIFGMPLDGDGNGMFTVEEINKNLGFEVEAIGSVGYDVEIARDNSYTGCFENTERKKKWYTGPAANLYKEGEVVKTIPSRDRDKEDDEDDGFFIQCKKQH